MKEIQNRIITKNEATGNRVVMQYIQEFWDCGWQPLDARNDRGIDGLIFMRRRGIDLGVKINVQIKCGAKYISSYNDKEIRISIHNESDLQQHIEYWKNQNEPTVLIFVNPCKEKRDKNGNILKEDGKTLWLDSRINAKAWWVNLKDPALQPEDTKTLIRLSKKNNFGEHSKGDFLKLIRPLISVSHLKKIIPNKDSKTLLNSQQLKINARDFYKKWKNNNEIFCKVINQKIRVSKTGWKHILSKSRGIERQSNSLRLLGIAKQMIDEVENFYLLNQKEIGNELEQRIALRARFNYQHHENIVQVILLRKFNKISKREKWWFYSVHYRR